MNMKPITTDRQLTWWITHLRRKQKHEYGIAWTIQYNTAHWSSIKLSEQMVRSLRGREGRQISKQYFVRIISEYADLPQRLEILIGWRGA